jgi:hypothetical protein
MNGLIMLHSDRRSSAARHSLTALATAAGIDKPGKRAWMHTLQAGSGERMVLG